MKHITLTITLIATLIHGTALAAERWDMPTAYSASNFHTEMVGVFAERVSQYTKGEVAITVHPNGTHTRGDEIKNAVQSGQVAIGERLMSAHSDEAAILDWDNVPFINASYADNARLWAIVRPAVERALAAMNLTVLYTCPWTGQGFFFQKPVASSADTQGLNFRAYNAGMEVIGTALGMNPMRIELADLDAALANNVVEAFASAPVAVYDHGLGKHMTHYYGANALFSRNYVIVNKGIWDGLAPAIKIGIERAARETARDCFAKSQELDGIYQTRLAEGGMVVTDAAPLFLAELKAIGSVMERQWVESVGDEAQAILDAYRGR